MAGKSWRAVILFNFRKFIENELLNPTILEKKDKDLFIASITYIVMICLKDKIN